MIHFKSYGDTMRKLLFSAYTLLAVPLSAAAMQACSGDDNAPSTPLDSGHRDTSTADSGGGDDTSIPQADTSPPPDSPTGTDASDGGCPASWAATPSFDPSLTPDGGSVIFHAAANGTQDYTCENLIDDAGTDANTFWVFTGPEANLADCTGTQVGSHFASDAGPTRPEWQTTDGTFVIAKKTASFDAGSGSIPWLLLQEVSTGGTGTLSKTLWVQRLNTDGGITPAGGANLCDAGATQKVPYTADYYFYGTP
jgi:hypothetical protein